MQRKKRSPAAARLASNKRAHLMREIVETLLFVGIVFLIVQFAIHPVRVVDNSMEPQLLPNQLVIVNRTAYFFGGPSRGDVIAYYNPTVSGQECIGRVIAVPNDTISITTNGVTVNGVTLNETYVQGNVVNQGIVPQTRLGQDKYFVLFDNRQVGGTSANGTSQNVCLDSRSFGGLPRQNIIGRAVLVFWPLSQFGGISNFSDVFKNVH